MDDFDARVSVLERSAAVREAVSREQQQTIERRFDHVEQGLGEIKGNLSRIVWLILTIIVGGVAKILFDGGAL